jgi:Ribbon-helix-helix protein, copG family
MKKTTVYLPGDLKERLEQRALGEQRSEAEVIRDALAAYLGDTGPRPTLPLFDGPPIDDFDEALSGFGTR